MSRLIGGQFIGTAPQCAVGKRRIEALYQGDYSPVSNFKNMNILLGYKPRNSRLIVL